jgi:MFS family permease
MTLVAGIWVKSLTGSSSAAALVAMCVNASSLLSLVAGMLADRVRRRLRMLIVVYLVSADQAAAAVSSVGQVCWSISGHRRGHVRAGRAGHTAAAV